MARSFTDRNEPGISAGKYPEKTRSDTGGLGMKKCRGLLRARFPSLFQQLVETLIGRTAFRGWLAPRNEVAHPLSARWRSFQSSAAPWCGRGHRRPFQSLAGMKVFLRGRGT